MSGGEWTTQRERKQLAADQRERDREMTRQSLPAAVVTLSNVAGRGCRWW